MKNLRNIAAVNFLTANHQVSCSAVVPKLFRAVTQIEVVIRSYHPQYFAVIAHNIEQNCGFGSAFPPKNRILPLGANLPPVWKSLVCVVTQEILAKQVLN